MSSQGVTLTDLQEAERTFSRSRVERQAQEQPSLKPVGPGALEGGPRKHEPVAAPTQEAGKSCQPWEVSAGVESRVWGAAGGLLLTGSQCLLLCSGHLSGSLFTEMILWTRKWQPIPVFLPGEPHGQRSLVGYSPGGRKESDTTWQQNNNSLSLAMGCKRVEKGGHTNSL